jgi:hypothetical protein
MFIVKSLSRGLALALSLGCIPALHAAQDCSEVDGITSICGLRSPEDIVVVSGGRSLLFSQMVVGGGIGLLDAQTDAVSSLYPGRPGQAEPGWGDTSCPGEVGEQVELHGLDLSQRTDGRWQLLAVNHGGRESVEFFEFIDGEEPTTTWRGCVVAPEDAHFNDVVALPAGGFLVTHMFPDSGQTWGMIRGLLGFNTGIVFRWHPAAGFEPLEWTAAPMPNGISLSADGEVFYVNAYFANEVRKYNLTFGELLGVAQVQSPDNSAWGPDGRLWVASHRHRWNKLADATPPEDGSPAALRFAIVAVDTDTMEGSVVLEREGPPMGAATVAVSASGYLYLGSYIGDRIIKLPLADL